MILIRLLKVYVAPEYWITKNWMEFWNIWFLIDHDKWFWSIETLQWSSSRYWVAVFLGLQCLPILKFIISIPTNTTFFKMMALVSRKLKFKHLLWKSFSNAFILSFCLKRDYRKLHRNIHSFHNCSLSACGEYHEIHFQLDREYQWTCNRWKKL